ncbi:hypothetical protein CHLRE_16g689087v5 [Chlamydomonas reinhardtii]|uniref:Reticulon-like protein n=1 Tax=Chlamydomonas reinhardtii TaxID=3055 RepID=A8JAH1_CHLRE|nr:uncharacterized protein CHLRE_16g689087v5 [Chlamydomonas reinhardtii]PNW72533.1 hypothetical protein CHLRE_16g689087v5 [Chlamydomonas reinhardtii]|eukprot:XP_001698908.1 reticulon-like protein [Chlamydomonas reinhardtii]
MADAAEHALGKDPIEVVKAELADTPVAGAVKQVASEMKTAFGSPQPEPLPEKPAPVPAATPEVNPAKQLNFTNLNPATPSTPPMVGAVGSEDVDYVVFINETLMWTNKVRSTFYFVAGLLAWVVVRAVSKSDTTLFTGLCYVLLASLFWNFLRAAMAPAYAARCTWAHSAVTRFLVASATATLNAAAALHDRHLHGIDPLHTLEVGLGLWVLSLLGRALPFVTLLLLLHIGAFTLPVAYKFNKGRVDGLIADVYGKAQAQYEKLDRRVRATAVLVPMAVLFVLLPTLDRVVAVFICLAYGRVWAKPDEFASFQKKRLEPVGATLHKAMTPLTGTVATTLNKYEITPTPRKKKI